MRGGPTISPAASTSYGTEAANEGKTRSAHSERSWRRAAPSFLAGETQAGFITTLVGRKRRQRKRGVSQICCAARQRIVPFVPPVIGRPGGKEAGEQGGRGKQGQAEQEEEEEESMESLNARLPPNHRSGKSCNSEEAPARPRCSSMNLLHPSCLWSTLGSTWPMSK